MMEAIILRCMNMPCLKFEPSSRRVINPFLRRRTDMNGCLSMQNTCFDCCFGHLTVMVAPPLVSAAISQDKFSLDFLLMSR